MPQPVRSNQVTFMLLSPAGTEAEQLQNSTSQHSVTVETVTDNALLWLLTTSPMSAFTPPTTDFSYHIDDVPLV